MRGQHLGRSDQRHARQGGLVPRSGGYPSGGCAIDRFGHAFAGWQTGVVVGIKRQHLIGAQCRAGLFDPLNADDIGARHQAGIVGQPDLGQDQAVIGGHMGAHVGYPRIQPGAGIQHHVHQIGREFDMDIVQFQHVAHRFFCR